MFKEISKEKYEEYKRIWNLCNIPHLLNEIIQLKKPKSWHLYKTFGKLLDENDEYFEKFYDLWYKKKLFK